MSIVPGRIVEISGECPGSTPKLPSVPGTTTISTSRETSSCSGVTNSNWTGITPPRRPCGGLSGRPPRSCRPCRTTLLARRRIRCDDALEALDRVFEIDEHAGRAGKDLGDMERLRQEA